MIRDYNCHMGHDLVISDTGLDKMLKFGLHFGFVVIRIRLMILFDVKAPTLAAALSKPPAIPSLTRFSVVLLAVLSTRLIAALVLNRTATSLAVVIPLTILMVMVPPPSVIDGTPLASAVRRITVVLLLPFSVAVNVKSLLAPWKVNDLMVGVPPPPL